jgi:hypothetical protein
MKHIHNQAERRSRQSKEMPQTYLLPACGWVSWIQLTLQKLLTSSLFLVFDFIYLFNVGLLENKKKKLRNYCLEIRKKSLATSNELNVDMEKLFESWEACAMERKKHWKVRFV